MNSKPSNEKYGRGQSEGHREIAPTRSDQALTDNRVEKLLTYDEVADLLGITVRTVYTLVKRGDLTALKVGGSSRVDPPDLRLFIEGAKITPSPVDGYHC